MDERRPITLFARVDRSGLRDYFFNNASILTAAYSQPPGFWGLHHQSLGGRQEDTPDSQVID